MFSLGQHQNQSFMFRPKQKLSQDRFSQERSIQDRSSQERSTKVARSHDKSTMVRSSEDTSNEDMSSQDSSRQEMFLDPDPKVCFDQVRDYFYPKQICFSCSCNVLLLIFIRELIFFAYLRTLAPLWGGRLCSC